MADPELRVRRIHGPELFSELVGKTEQSIRDLFKEAQENHDNHEKGESPLYQYLIIIDEIDAMFGTRGKDLSSGVADRSTASFISMMDKLHLRKNLFFMATTNRYDMVDPAVSRQGRLGLHLEIAALENHDKLDILRLAL